VTIVWTGRAVWLNAWSSPSAARAARGARDRPH
jgi:hypothetical protein